MTDKPKRTKFCYVGAPAIFLLDQALVPVVQAFDGYAYLVGSALERPDWRDVDVRLIMEDAAFKALFPDAPLTSASWELDTRWRLMTIAIAQHLSAVTGLPVDFQFQPQTFANEKHKGRRNPLGRAMAKEVRDE